MQIRTRITFQFIILVAFIIACCFILIYYFASSYRESEFYERLENKSKTTAELLISVNQIDSVTLRLIDKNQKDQLPFENIEIYNQRNEQIYTNNDHISFRITPAILAQIKESGRLHFVQGSHEVLGMIHRQNDEDYIVFAGAVDSYGYSKIRNLGNTLILLFITCIFIVAVAGWFFARRALRPLNDVIGQINSLSLHNLHARLIPSDSRDEIARLISTFNQQLNRVEHAFNVQKIFLSGASHEIKNPLTIITSTLQVALLNERTNEEYKTAIRSVLEDMQKLNKTTNDLIDYTRLSYDTHNSIQLQDTRIDDIIWRSKDIVHKSHPKYTIQVEFVNPPDDESDLVINANAILLCVAFVNLVENACKFSTDNTVLIKLYEEKTQLKITFTNQGSHILPEHRELIFEPFFRVDNSTKTRGDGIGLALVKTILNLHHATISVDSPEHTTIFTVVCSKKF